MYNSPPRILPIQLISLDISHMYEYEELSKISMAIEDMLFKNMIIIVCGDFAQSNDKLQELVVHAPKLQEHEISQKLTPVIDIHKQCLSSILLHVQNQDLGYKREKVVKAWEERIAMAMEEIDSIYSNIRSLINGVRLIKEISSRTKSLLSTHASQLAAVVLQSFIVIVHLSSFDIVLPATITSSKEPLPPINKIIPVLDQEHTKDILVAQLACKFKVSSLNIWTHLHGVMTADPQVVSNAKAIPFMDHETALEMAYLGGEILHPSAIHLLTNDIIPIKIYSFYQTQTQTPATTISSDAPVSKSQCMGIITRDSFTILSISSTRMFEASGYLESVFKVFREMQISVETLTTSDISIAIAFDTKYFSDELVQRLSKLGNIELLHNQTILSIIATNGHWKKPAEFATILQHVDKSISFNMISLAQSGNNLNFVLSNSDVSNVLETLHEYLFC